MGMRTKLLAAMALAFASGLTAAAGPVPGAGHGPGMMGGDGPRMMEGFGSGGYGQGMMGDCPGMTGGHGPGAMGGRGAGTMYFGRSMQYSLGLTDEQRRKVDAIHDDVQARNWEITGKMRGEMARIRDLASAEPLYRKALDDTYKRINDLRQQRFDAGITARSQIEGVLTAEQKERFRSFGPGWPGDID